MRRLLTVLGVVTASALGLGFPGDNQPLPKPPPPVMPHVDEPLISLADGVKEAARDAKRFEGFSDTKYIRYLFVQDASPYSLRSGSLALNFISYSGQPKPPAVAARGFLLRLDARDYATEHPEFLDRWLKTWEKLKLDPAFVENKLDENNVLQASILSSEVPPQEWLYLTEVLHTEAPIVTLPYFIARSLTTIQGQFGNAEIYGGLYYQFLGIGDEDATKEFFGIGDGKVTLAAFYKRLPSLRIAAVRKRRLTGKKSRILVFPSESRIMGGWGAITEDPDDGNDGGVFDPIRNLDPFPHPDSFGFKPAAKEAFFSLPNRLTLAVLWNGAGVRQDEAPPQVAKSKTYIDRFGNENPHAARLQPLIQCMECHMATNPALDGWQPLESTIKSYEEAGLFPVENRRYLQDLYQGVDDEFVNTVRNNLHAGVLKSIEDWPKGDPRRAVPLATSHIYKLYADYVYEPVDARIALKELGIPAPANNPEKLFGKLVPPIPVENDVIHELRSGGYVSRFDWDQTRAMVWRRMKR